jgi:hypothetical protein
MRYHKNATFKAAAIPESCLAIVRGNELLCKEAIGVHAEQEAQHLQ